MNRHPISSPIRAIALAALCAPLAMAWAQEQPQPQPQQQQQPKSIYRCGDMYSQQPCAGGKVVATEDLRSAGQRQQSDAATRRDAKTADSMEKARLALEEKPAQVAIPPAAVSPVSNEPGDKPVLRKPKKPAYFTAVSPRKPGETPLKKKTKAAKKNA